MKRNPKPSRFALIPVFLLGFGSGSPAEAQQCPPDQDWNTHPLFRALTTSPVVETFASLIEATSLRFGDMNGDGLEDAICGVAIEDSHVAIMLGRGDGLFDRRIAVTAGDEDALEIADAYPVDLDGDGDLDIATANARADDATMLFNDGNANFTRGPRYPLGDEPRSLVAGDLDGDGDQDLAYLNVISQDVSILLNRGDGTFDPEIRVPVGSTTPRGQPNRNFAYPGPFLAIGDLDGDNDLDIIVPGGDEAEILLNDGDAGFALSNDPPRITEFMFIYDIEARDLDGDGDLDLAAAIYGSRSFLAVWLNDGSGGFTDATLYDARVVEGFNHFSTSVALGDLDNDGDLDAIVGNEFHGRYALFRNQGDGTFAPPETPLITQGPWLVEIMDTNRDAWGDLVAITEQFSKSDMITQLNDATGTPRGSFEADLDGPQDFEYSAIDTADLDGDGDLDLVLAVQSNSPLHIRVMENDGTGMFVERFRMLVGEGSLTKVEDVKLVDLDGDKRLDLVMSWRANLGDGTIPGTIMVALRESGFAFRPVIRTELVDLEPYEIGIADIDADGDPDVLVHCFEVFDPDDPTLPRDMRVVILTNDARGGLNISQQIVLDTSNRNRKGAVEAVDLDGDGDLDVLASSARRATRGLVHILINDGTGHVDMFDQIDVSAGAISGGITVRAGDFDADGDADLAVLHWNVQGDVAYLKVLENAGDATFAITQTFRAPEIWVWSDLKVEDIDGDGSLDLVCVSARSGPVIHLNDGTGDFSNWAWYAATAPASDLAFGDFDLDGDTDIISPAWAGLGFAELIMLENVACLCAADLDHDGVLTAEDFFLFLDRYASGNIAFCDVDHDADCDAEDFFAYLDLFAAGCS